MYGGFFHYGFSAIPTHISDFWLTHSKCLPLLLSVQFHCYCQLYQHLGCCGRVKQDFSAKVISQSFHFWRRKLKNGQDQQFGKRKWTSLCQQSCHRIFQTPRCKQGVESALDVNKKKWITRDNPKDNTVLVIGTCCGQSTVCIEVLPFVIYMALGMFKLLRDYTSGRFLGDA